jgi:hypothetical protein
VQDTCNVTNATAIHGHLEKLLFDFRPASMVTVLDKKCLACTAEILTTVPLFPLGGNSMFNHVYVLTTGTMNLAEGHGDLRSLA